MLCTVYIDICNVCIYILLLIYLAHFCKSNIVAEKDGWKTTSLCEGNFSGAMSVKLQECFSSVFVSLNEFPSPSSNPNLEDKYVPSQRA